ncbi:MAG: hypothetical protein RLZZ299_1828 [Pseudomonadota bacterium]|jgi:hypothetical protein
MLLCLAGLALATHVTTFDIDPLYTRGAFTGFESLLAEPATLQSQLRPASTAPGGAEPVKNAAAAGEKALVFTNPANNGAELSVNGTKVGWIGPYATVRMDGLARGAYTVRLAFTTGYVRTFQVVD